MSETDTQRRIIVIEMGRIRANGNLVPEKERLETLETFDGVSARVFYTPQYDLINGEVRRFYRAVLGCIGLPSCLKASGLRSS